MGIFDGKWCYPVDKGDRNGVEGHWGIHKAKVNELPCISEQIE